MNANATAALSRTNYGSAAPRPGRRGGLYVPLLLTGLALAMASFVGSTLYADARLEQVAQRTHAVSDNAMPSLAELARARYELAQVRLLVDESVEGEADAPLQVAPHWKAFEEAIARYTSLPQFPGEPEVWGAGQAHVADVRRLTDVLLGHVAARELGVASTLLERDLGPAVHRLDETLERLVDLNDAQGRIAADEADAAWARTRRLSILLDVICAVATSGLAVAAYLAFSRYAAVTAHRAEELEGFAARVAHDIRGPLAPAMYALESVSRHPGPEGEGRRRAAERGLRSLRRVETLVGDLLVFARSGAAPEADCSAALPAVVAGVAQDLEPEASAARVEVRTEDLPACEVACSPGVLTSIVLNLVSNAIKHFPADTEPRRVVVRAAARGARVRVEVADTGAGLPPEAAACVFEPYVRLDTRRPGLGLGLATVRRLIESHAGSVGVRSRPGGGATFWFEMPLRRNPPAE